MALRIPFRLLRRAEPALAVAVLLESDDPATLLAACAGLPEPLVFPVAGGFLIVADSIPAAIPDAIRLRRLCENGYIPVDADLSPALLPAEVVDLTSRRGLVLLPGRPPLAFDSNRPFKPAAFLAVPTPHRADWEPFPAGSPPADRLTGITRVLPETPDELLQSDGPPIGTDDIRPPEVGPGRRVLGRMSAGLGNTLRGLGKALGSSKLSKLGAKLTGMAAALAPRLTEELLGRQEAALQQLLKRFRDGRTDEALRHAVPIGEPSRGGRIYNSDRLPTHSLLWSLSGLFGGGGGAPSIWAGGNPETWRDLIAEYRRAAEAAADRGDFRRAALIYAKLLGDFRAAAEVLSRGGLHRQAGNLFRDKCRQLDRAAREFEQAGEHDEALRLYRDAHLYLEAGDLLRRLGDEEAAIAEYHQAAGRAIELRKDYVEAGDILLKKTGRADLASAYFALGWGERGTSLGNAQNALPCAERLIEIYAFAESRDEFWVLLTEAEDWLREPGWAHDAGRFFNKVAALAELPHLAPDRPEIRDRCRLGLAGKLREHAKTEATAGTAVSDLFGHSQRWSPAVVWDADVAVRAAQKNRPRQEKPAPAGMRLIHLWTGTVTAAVQAPDSGELFVGFQEGAVISFDTVTSATRVLYPDTGFPVLGIATDLNSVNVVALREEGTEPPAEWLKSYALDLAQGRGTSHVPVARTTWVQEPDTLLGILPVINHPDMDPLVLISTTLGIGTYSLPGLIARAEHGPPNTLPPTTHLWLWVTEMECGCSRVQFQGGSIAWSGGRAYIGWMPDPAPGSTLFSPPVAWLLPSRSHVELAGLFDNATLYWTEVQRQSSNQLLSRTLAFPAPGGFRAVCIWRPGQVVGVTATNRVIWLKARAGRFEEWALPVDISVPSRAVACFSSVGTDEVQVVLEDGHLVRIPYPGESRR